MKRIWNAIGKTAKDGKFQSNAIKQVEKIETGSVKIAAPKQAAELNDLNWHRRTRMQERFVLF
jgi:hypothetical protein